MWGMNKPTVAEKDTLSMTLARVSFSATVKPNTITRAGMINNSCEN